MGQFQGPSHVNSVTSSVCDLHVRIDDRRFPVPPHATAEPARPETHLQDRAGSQRRFNLVKVSMSPSLSRGKAVIWMSVEGTLRLATG